MKDQSFDGLAKKFHRNIYGTTKGRLRHQLLCDALDECLGSFTSKRIIELGGGTGVMSDYLSRQGHDVTLTDVSSEILTLAEQHLSDDITIRHADLFSVSDLYDFDVIICHAVLEWLAEPQQAIKHIAGQMRQDSYLSLTFFNRDAALFGNAIYGNFDYIARGMKVKNQVRLNPQMPLSPQHVISWVAESGLEIISQRGIRCFHDYMRQKDMAESHYDELLTLERQFNTQAPFMWMGKYFHLWLRKTC